MSTLIQYLSQNDIVRPILVEEQNGKFFFNSFDPTKKIQKEYWEKHNIVPFTNEQIMLQYPSFENFLEERQNKLLSRKFQEENNFQKRLTQSL